MSQSSVIQRALASSLKKLMLTTPITKITVQQIVDDCGTTRRTFYNHFHDIYELLRWVYHTEIIAHLDEYRSLRGWKRGLLLVLGYTQDNRTFCLNAFRSVGRDHLEAFLYGVLYDMMLGVVEELAGDGPVTVTDRRDLADFYTCAVLARLLRWLNAGARTDPAAVVRGIGRIMDGCVEDALRRYERMPDAPAPAQ